MPSLWLVAYVTEEAAWARLTNGDVGKSATILVVMMIGLMLTYIRSKSGVVGRSLKHQLLRDRVSCLLALGRSVSLFILNRGQPEDIGTRTSGRRIEPFIQRMERRPGTSITESISRRMLVLSVLRLIESTIGIGPDNGGVVMAVDRGRCVID